MKSSSTKIESRITKALESAFEQFLTSDANLGAAINQKRECYLMVNSSFLYRDKRLVRTPQSSKRLVAKLSAGDSSPKVGEIWVNSTTTIKTHYRLFDSLKDSVTPLRKAVATELGSMGDLIFVLLATIKGLRTDERPVKSGIVKMLRLEPKQKKSVSLKDNVASIKEIIPIEDLFEKIQKETNGTDALSEKDRQAIREAYDSLIDGATTDVVIGRGKPEDSVLGKIRDSLRSQASEYEKAVNQLDKNLDDQAALHEVLRLAYNFSTDVLPLICLFMSICDLKPLIFWCTVDKQWGLYRAFASLPWAALGRKERLEDYREIVAAARNQAFHHVLPFDGTIEVDLADLDVRAERLRLFPPYGKKQEGGIRLKDQELVDTFAEFARARQRPVSLQFWKANLSVMKAATDLAEEMVEALELIRQSRLEDKKKK